MYKENETSKLTSMLEFPKALSRPRPKAQFMHLPATNSQSSHSSPWTQSLPRPVRKAPTIHFGLRVLLRPIRAQELWAVNPSSQTLVGGRGVGGVIRGGSSDR